MSHIKCSVHSTVKQNKSEITLRKQSCTESCIPVTKIGAEVSKMRSKRIIREPRNVVSTAERLGLIAVGSSTNCELKQLTRVYRVFLAVVPRSPNAILGAGSNMHRSYVDPIPLERRGKLQSFVLCSYRGTSVTSALPHPTSAQGTSDKIFRG